MRTTRAFACAFIYLALLTPSISGSGAEGGDGGGGALFSFASGTRTPRNSTALGVLLGGPSGSDTDSCGSTSGTFPAISVNKGLQLGCFGAFKSQTVSFTITQGSTSSGNNVFFCSLQGDECRSGSVITTTADCSNNYYLTTGQGVEGSYTCKDATCCVVTFCDNLYSACSNLSYKFTFTGLLSDGAVAGIAVGCVLFVGIVAFAVLRGCGKRAGEATGAPPAAAYTQINPQLATMYQQSAAAAYAQPAQPPPAGWASPQQPYYPPAGGYQQQAQAYAPQAQAYQQAPPPPAFTSSYPAPRFMTAPYAPQTAPPPQTWG